MIAARLDEPVLSLQDDPQRPGCKTIKVSNLNPDLIASFGTGSQADNLLRSALQVSVVQSKNLQEQGLPTVSGRYWLSGDGLNLCPHFPFEPGVRYRAIFNQLVTNSADSSERLVLDFKLPASRSEVALAEVTQIYPTAESLPENLIRFYVCFSAPMARGKTACEILVLGPDGKEATDVLYRAPVELWDREMMHLTVLLDPGRLKRGVGPNVELGPPLEVGKTYTLVVGSSLADSFGRPLRCAFWKRFAITAPVRERVTTEHWKVSPPLAGSCRPLLLTFPRSLDWALLQQAIDVALYDGQLVEGAVEIDQCETGWRFVPKMPWKVGSYIIRIRTWLEDVCGNTPAAAFDRDFRGSSGSLDDGSYRSIAFEVGNDDFGIDSCLTPRVDSAWPVEEVRSC